MPQEVCTNPGFQVVKANIFRTVVYDVCESSATIGAILLFSGAQNFQVVTRFWGKIFAPFFFYSQISKTINTWEVSLGGKVRTIFLVVIFSQ